MPSTPNDDLSSITKTIHAQLRALRGLRQTSSRGRAQFTLDLALVCLSIRTGYLVDAITVHVQDPLQIFTSLLRSLRQALSIFNSLSIIYEPRSEQTFFINTRLLHSRLKQCLQTYPHTPITGLQSSLVEDQSHLDVSLIVLGPNAPTIDPIMPADLRQLLQNIATRLDALGSGPDNDLVFRLPESRPSTMIPLAAFLLEYPVAYCPSPEMPLPFLNGISLDVYDCVLITAGVSREDDETFLGLHNHTLMKFSCPHGLDIELSAQIIRARLYEHFMARLAASRMNVSIQVRHTQDTFDRVAL